MIKHSNYFEGKVQSLGMNTKEGYATVGVIEPGAYTFNTASEEHLTIIEGTIKAKLPGKDWTEVRTGEKIIVQANASFEIEATEDAAYICFYK